MSSQLTDQILICHTSYHRTKFYMITRETPKCVFVKPISMVGETIYSDPTHVRRIITSPEATTREGEKEYRLSKRDDKFVGKADSCRVETYELWDGQPTQTDTYRD